jgi:hypothetical protein
MARIDGGRLHPPGMSLGRSSGALSVLGRLWRNCRGVTALEFALVFPITLLFILGTLELDRVMFMKLQLQAAVADASRYGFTGNASQDAADQVACPLPYPVAVPINTNYEITCRVQKDLCPASQAPPQGSNAPLSTCNFDLIDPNLQITIENFASLQDLAQNGTPANGPGLGNEVAQYNVTYNLPLATGIFNHIFGASVQIQGFAIVLNEPFLSPSS